MLSVLPTLLQPPPTAEELALKEQVTQALTSQGVLARLKAELRAAVFEVMHEREGFTKSNDPNVPKLKDFPLETRATALALIVECLEFFHWEHALRVLLAESDGENERHDCSQVASKLGFDTKSSSRRPTLFQLVESSVLRNDQAPEKSVLKASHDQFDEDYGDAEKSQTDIAPEPKVKRWDEDKSNDHPTEKIGSKVNDNNYDEANDKGSDEEDEISAEIEESMAEEIPSGSELEESNFTNYDDEESHDRNVIATKEPRTLYSARLDEQDQHDDKDLENDKDDRGSNDDDTVALAAPPPAPAKLPSLPPLVGAQNMSLHGDVDDDFDAEEEAARLRMLDAALQAMEAEDDTGTLHQLKASLQMELQEQDSFVSSGGLNREGEEDEDEAASETKASKTGGNEEASETKASKTGGNEEEEDDGYGSSDFEEEEEIASDISEEMESMPELSDKEDESEDGAVSAAELEPPGALQNDTRVDSEDALNSYDYIEDVEKGGW